MSPSQAGISDGGGGDSGMVEMTASQGEGGDPGGGGGSDSSFVSGSMSRSFGPMVEHVNIK